jgi:hypothetical protein
LISIQTSKGQFYLLTAASFTCCLFSTLAVPCLNYNKMAEQEQQNTFTNAKAVGNKASSLPLVVRSYFQEVVKDDGDTIEAICNLCKPKKNVIRGQYKAPSNFTKHIQVWARP